MEISFETKSDHFSTNGNNCDTILITIYIHATSEVDGDYEIMDIKNLTSDKTLSLSDFPKDERDWIEKECEEILCENVESAYRENRILREEALYDSWKCGDF